MQSFSRHALTKEKDLQGEKDKGNAPCIGTAHPNKHEFDERAGKNCCDLFYKNKRQNWRSKINKKETASSKEFTDWLYQMKGINA